MDESVGAEASREEVKPGVPAGMTEDGIELEVIQSRPQGAEIMDA